MHCPPHTSVKVFLVRLEGLSGNTIILVTTRSKWSFTCIPWSLLKSSTKNQNSILWFHLVKLLFVSNVLVSQYFLLVFWILHSSMWYKIQKYTRWCLMKIYLQILSPSPWETHSFHSISVFKNTGTHILTTSKWGKAYMITLLFTLLFALSERSVLGSIYNM